MHSLLVHLGLMSPASFSAFQKAQRFSLAFIQVHQVLIAISTGNKWCLAWQALLLQGIDTKPLQDSTCLAPP